MTTCLVVGGGFIGSHVAEVLALRGHAVSVYSRSFNPGMLATQHSGPGTVDLIEGAVPPGKGLQELIEAAEIVFYLAGESTPATAKSDPGGSITGLVVPAVAVFDLMRPTSTRRVVVASSGGTVYGVADHFPTPESHPTRPISVHGQSSLTVERYAGFFAQQYGFEPIILRYANPYGPGQLARRGQGVIAAWCDALAQHREVVVYGDLTTRRDFVYVVDAAEATIAAAFEAPRPGIYNVGSGTSTSLDNVLAIIETVAGRTARIRRVGGRGIDVPATGLDCLLLRQATGWSPQVGVTDGVRATWDWTRRAVESAG
ncbi:MAG TPA: NAD-dependent epimerase/dehydratase family protein [Acidimicrobiales bacterium]|jgi:UDP-glucose 4-epimerase|nr:NAD-dependent epimerase/dehydratase family protein [Acidimicrobiales bacterium]